MPIIERDVVLQGVTGDGKPTIDLPVTRLGNIEDTADIKQTPEEGDYIPIIDSADQGQMKKVPWSAARGEAGAQGPAGAKGDKGDPGPQGDPFTYADFTPEQLEALRGPRGLQGETGAQGPTGQDGKSAFQYAQEGGYPGTEAEFRELMGLTGTIAARLDTINGEEI